MATVPSFDLPDYAQAEGDQAAADMLERQAEVLARRASQLREEAAELSAQVVVLRTEVERIRQGDRLRVQVRDLAPRKPYGTDDAYMMRRVADALARFGEPITSTALADHLNAGQVRVRACLQRLEALGQVRRTGLARGTRWALIAEDDQDAQDVAATADLNGARTLEAVIRDACRDLEVFTFEDLAEKLPDVSQQSLRRWLPKLEARGTRNSEVLGSGKNSRTKLYEFVRGADMAHDRHAVRRRQETPEAMAVRNFGHMTPKRRSAVAGTGGGQTITDQGTRELVEAVRAQGADVVRDGKGHWQVVRDGKPVIADDGRPLNFSSTPGDVRDKKNARARLRRSGFVVK